MKGAGAAVFSPQFLAACLARPVDEVRCERIGVEWGFAGTVLRVRVRSEGRMPMSVVAKVGADSRLESEVRFYRELAAELGAPAPRCWYAGRLPDGRPVVLLEDLAAARQGDALAGASVEDVAAVLASMAAVWRRRAGDPNLPALPEWRSDPATRQERFGSQWASQRDHLRGELSEIVWAIGERLCGRLAAVVAELRRGHDSVVHADLHLDNILFAPAAAGTRAVVLDWGSICVGPPAVDIFPFLAMALSVEDHTRHAADLIATLALPGAAVDDGRRALLCTFAGVIGWRHRPATAIPRERALRAAALGDGRLANALQQWDALSIL